MTIVGKIILALIGLGAAYFQARANGGDKVSAAISKALRNALDDIERANAARLEVDAAAHRDPAGILRDDDGWRRE